MDGACTVTDDTTRFHRAPAPSQAELERLLDTFVWRITRTLVRAGPLVEDPEQPWLDLDVGSPLEQLAAAVRYRITVGPLAGHKIMTLHSASAVTRDGVTVKALTAARDGFALNAAVACEAHHRDVLDAASASGVRDRHQYLSALRGQSACHRRHHTAGADHPHPRASGRG